MTEYFKDITTTRRVYNWAKISSAVRSHLAEHLVNDVRYRFNGIFYDRESRRIEIELDMYCPCDQDWKPVDGNFIGDGRWWYFTTGMMLSLELDYFDVPLHYYAK